MPTPPDTTQRLLALARIDLRQRHDRPVLGRVALATVLAVIASLVADAALVAIGTHLFPSTHGYTHFRFADYARLTVVGVIGAGAAWPVVASVSFGARWLYFRLALLVSAVLLLPDLYIWHQGQPARAVAVLMCMHVAIGVVTYNLMVRLAPLRLDRVSAAA